MDEFAGVLNVVLTPRPPTESNGPRCCGFLGVMPSGRGRHVGAGIFDVRKLSPAIVTDWAAPLLDGDLSLDVSIDIEPLDLGSTKLQFDTRRNALESSPPTPGRYDVTRADISLRMASI
jgi:hypothetical protein